MEFPLDGNAASGFAAVTQVALFAPSHTTVAVLLGGWSAEREVSLNSGKACTAALQRAGFKANHAEPQVVRIEQIQKGRWTAVSPFIGN